MVSESVSLPRTASRHLLLAVGLHLGLLLGNFVVHRGLYALSELWWVYQDFSTWYLPLGWRLGLLILLPMRYWPTLILSGQLVYFSVGALQENAQLDALALSHTKEFVISLLLYLAPAWLAIRLAGRAKPGEWLAEPKRIQALLAAMVLNQLGNVYTLSGWVVEHGPVGDKLEIALSFFVGGFIGLLFSAPTLLAIAHLWLERDQIRWHAVLQPFSAMLAIAVIAIVLYQSFPSSLYLLRALAFVPLLYAAARYGWPGAWCTSLTIMLLLAFTVAGDKGTTSLLEQQFYIFTFGLSGLILGAVMSQQQRLLAEQRALSERNRQLLRKLANIQESERKSLSQDLHDQVGQNLFSLQTDVALLERQHPFLSNTQALQQIKRNGKEIYQTIYQLLHWLRPRVLDEFGLSALVNGDFFQSRLARKNIQFIAVGFATANTLPNDLQAAVFRILQEATTNCIKHSSATKFTATLSIQHDQMELHLADDGKGCTHQGLPFKDATGLGLAGIKDRVETLGGQAAFDGQQGFHIHIDVPLRDNQ